MLLLDTNVVSELRKVAGGKAHPNVALWNETVDPAETFISSVVLHELEIGVRLVEHTDPAAGKGLRIWLENTRRRPFRRPNFMCPIPSRSTTPTLRQRPSPVVCHWLRAISKISRIWEWHS
jgi:hypothetical protein